MLSDVMNRFLRFTRVLRGVAEWCNVTGTLNPDSTGNYGLIGQYLGRDCYRRLDSTYFIWWDGTDTWTISTVLGTDGTNYWQRTDTAIVGVYSNEGSATGNATVVEGQA